MKYTREITSWRAHNASGSTCGDAVYAGATIDRLRPRDRIIYNEISFAGVFLARLRIEIRRAAISR